ncbi:hypothetical protein AAG570_004393 [Ranatra chinensis]|uniref:Single domain-containing protein n=1 Tax=Ranatra chinensis TaxID=642074 RepID=A0ABD0YPA4_9HEMI
MARTTALRERNAEDSGVNKRHNTIVPGRSSEKGIGGLERRTKIRFCGWELAMYQRGLVVVVDRNSFERNLNGDNPRLLVILLRIFHQWRNPSRVMNTFIVLFVGVAAFVIHAEAQVALELQNLQEGEAEVCKDGDKIYQIGDTWRERDSCTRKSCSRYTKPRTMLVQYSGCGKILPSDSSCRLGKPDLSKPYPECCPVVWCN